MHLQVHSHPTMDCHYNRCHCRRPSVWFRHLQALPNQQEEARWGWAAPMRAKYNETDHGEGKWAWTSSRYFFSLYRPSVLRNWTHQSSARAHLAPFIAQPGSQRKKKTIPRRARGGLKWRWKRWTSLNLQFWKKRWPWPVVSTNIWSVSLPSASRNHRNWSPNTWLGISFKNVKTETLTINTGEMLYVSCANEKLKWARSSYSCGVDKLPRAWHTCQKRKTATNLSIAIWQRATFWWRIQITSKSLISVWRKWWTRNPSSLMIRAVECRSSGWRLNASKKVYIRTSQTCGALASQFGSC